MPSWRPETGHILFGDDRPHLFAWLPSVPQGTVQATLASDITAERKYGHTQVPIFMLAKDGKILADDSALVRFEKTGEPPDPVTGKPVADTTVYDHDAAAHGGEHYRVTFRRENTIVQARMIESVKGPKRVLAQLAGFGQCGYRGPQGVAGALGLGEALLRQRDQFGHGRVRVGEGEFGGDEARFQAGERDGVREPWFRVVPPVAGCAFA